MYKCELEVIAFIITMDGLVTIDDNILVKKIGIYKITKGSARLGVLRKHEAFYSKLDK